MLHRRLFNAEPPPAHSSREDRPTLLVSWWCTIFALVTILIRLSGRYIRTERFFREDQIMAASIVPLLARMALVHVVLIYGTNNTLTAGLTDSDIHEREIGSRVVLLSRIMYAAFLWTEKLTITEFLERLTSQAWKKSYEKGLVLLRWFLLATFVAVCIATIAECQPFTHYWQVSPDPGPKCRQGYGQLITLAVCNVITDLLLIIFPIPIVILSQMAVKRKIQLTLLFCLSVFPIAVTLFRVQTVIENQGSQQRRSLWASVEILFACAISNALVLGSFLRDRGAKKPKFKFGSTGDSVDRSKIRRGTNRQIWGSDEDLVRGLGLGVGPEVPNTTIPRGPRAAPVIAMPSGPRKTYPPAAGLDFVARKWTFPAAQASGEADTNLIALSVNPSKSRPAEAELVDASPRQPALFDIGGLLEDGDAPSDRHPEGQHSRSHSTPAASPTDDPPISQVGSLSPASAARSSVSLQDGRSLRSHASARTKVPHKYNVNISRDPSYAPWNHSQNPRVRPASPLAIDGRPLGVIPSVTALPDTGQELRDVGGLLRS
ncbi:MAG: hypothetical protein M1829_004446 [Trizodia sp. TS-e1964]|nr:MAG: hypothetical protein M1829_004446 [Trizodia sp. TS-e1964]